MTLKLDIAEYMLVVRLVKNILLAKNIINPTNKVNDSLVDKMAYPKIFNKNLTHTYLKKQTV